MRNLQYEFYRVKREIEIHGKEYTFYRRTLDEYKERTNNAKKVATIKALFHTEKGYTSRNIIEGSNIRYKGQPKLLALFDSAKDIKIEDEVRINNSTYKVTDINDVELFGIVCDISIEKVLNSAS